MRKLILSLVLLSSVCFAGMWDNDYTFPIALITAPQDVTSVWTDVGVPIKVNGFQRIALDVDLDINSANNVRLRWVRQITSGAADRLHMIETVSASAVSVEDRYYEFNVDADQVVTLDFSIFPIQFVQLQTSAGTEGGTKAQLDAISYFLLRE